MINMKKYLQIIFLMSILFATSCKPEYPVPVFNKNEQIKYFIHEKRIINDDTNTISYSNDTMEFEYDDKNRLVKIFGKNSISFPYQELYSIKYKKDHILLTRYIHDRIEDTLNRSYKIKYYLDDNGNIIEQQFFDKNNNFEKTYSYNYNNNQLVAFYKRGVLTEEYKYFNDYFQIIDVESNNTKNLYYGNTKSNLSLFFYENYKHNPYYFIIYNDAKFYNTITNIEYPGFNIITNLFYSYNSDSLINEIIYEEIINSKDTIIHIFKETSFYKIVY